MFLNEQVKKFQILLLPVFSTYPAIIRKASCRLAQSFTYLLALFDENLSTQTKGADYCILCFETILICVRPLSRLLEIELRQTNS